MRKKETWLWIGAIVLSLIWHYGGEPWSTAAAYVAFIGAMIIIPKMIGDAVEADCTRIAKSCMWDLENEVARLKGRVSWLEQQRERDRLGTLAPNERAAYEFGRDVAQSIFDDDGGNHD